MKANELRIGNYFLDRGGKILQLHFWDAPGKLAMNNVIEGITCHPYTEEVEYASPIPLKEAWLKKLGFSEDDHGFKKGISDYGHMRFYKENHARKMYCELGTTGGYRYSNPEIKYVHQLQNLYFVLTGEELSEL